MDPEDYMTWKMLKIRKPTYDRISELRDHDVFRGIYGHNPTRGEVIDRLIEILDDVEKNGPGIRRFPFQPGKPLVGLAVTEP